MDAASAGIVLSANLIHDNAGLGIDLLAAIAPLSGVTANDAGDADTGANNLQNHPQLTSATTYAGNQIELVGVLDSAANSFYRIEFFASPVADASGFGEGQTYLGFANVATDGAGHATVRRHAGRQRGRGQRRQRHGHADRCHLLEPHGDFGIRQRAAGAGARRHGGGDQRQHQRGWAGRQLHPWCWTRSPAPT